MARNETQLISAEIELDASFYEIKSEQTRLCAIPHFRFNTSPVSLSHAFESLIALFLIILSALNYKIFWQHVINCHGWSTRNHWAQNQDQHSRQSHRLIPKIGWRCLRGDSKVVLISTKVILVDRGLLRPVLIQNGWHACDRPFVVRSGIDMPIYAANKMGAIFCEKELLIEIIIWISIGLIYFYEL
ncbi:hypothetical protein ACJX0J_025264, partial [Zea mays]